MIETKIILIIIGILIIYTGRRIALDIIDGKKNIFVEFGDFVSRQNKIIAEAVRVIKRKINEKKKKD